ncbi:MAG: long-chain-fatty-acid--CoA ligase [Comamonas sp.]
MQDAHLRFWPKGLPRNIQVPEVPLTHFLEVAAQRYPGKVAIAWCGTEMRYGALLARVNALAGYLQSQLQVRPGDRVLLVSQNCPQYITAFYAILRAGGVVVPVNAMCTAAEMVHYVEDSGAKVALVAQELLPNVLPCMAPALAQGLAGVLAHTYSDLLTAEARAALDADVPEVFLAPRQQHQDSHVVDMEDAIGLGLAPVGAGPAADDLCSLWYTSGTTGRTKGCMHSHRSILTASISSILWRGMHAESIFLGAAPLFHGLGMQNGMILPLVLGATVVMLPRWSARAAAALIECYRVSIWVAPPAMLVDFFAHPDAATRDLSSLSLLIGGGAAVPAAVAQALLERFGLVLNESYGMSETAAFLHGNPVNRSKQQCLGIPGPGVDTRIVDPVTLEELAQGETGEIVTSGGQVMLGYWRNEEANRAVFFERDGKRFLRTGDLGSIDEDGYFFMRDRLKRMINASGFKVWPAELETALYAHPAIHEVCIIGVPDAKRGETVKALVVLKPGQQERTTEQDIIGWSRERMAAYKVPQSVEFLEHLPKSATGKIQWKELQDAYQRPAG